MPCLAINLLFVGLTRLGCVVLPILGTISIGLPIAVTILGFLLGAVAAKVIFGSTVVARHDFTIFTNRVHFGSIKLATTELVDQCKHLSVQVGHTSWDLLLLVLAGPLL